MPLSTIF